MRFEVALFLVLLAVVVPPAVMAETTESAPLQVNLADISGRSLSGASGVIGVNASAANDTRQANLRSLQIGGETQGGVVSISQQAGPLVEPQGPYIHQDRIGDQALSASRGLISVNQTSGDGTAQANLASINLGVEGIPASAAELLATNAQQVGPLVMRTDPGQQRDLIEGAAFSGSQGVIQVNQSAGSANRVLNTFGINVKRLDIN